MRKAISSYLPLLVLILSARASESFQWQTDEGWFGERILLPPRFAPDMSWKGVEEIRILIVHIKVASVILGTEQCSGHCCSCHNCREEEVHDILCLVDGIPKSDHGPPQYLIVTISDCDVVLTSTPQPLLLLQN